MKKEREYFRGKRKELSEEAKEAAALEWKIKELVCQAQEVEAELERCAARGEESENGNMEAKTGTGQQETGQDFRELPPEAVGRLKGLLKRVTAGRKRRQRIKAAGSMAALFAALFLVFNFSDVVRAAGQAVEWVEETVERLTAPIKDFHWGSGSQTDNGTDDGMAGETESGTAGSEPSMQNPGDGGDRNPGEEGSGNETSGEPGGSEGEDGQRPPEGHDISESHETLECFWVTGLCEVELCHFDTAPAQELEIHGKNTFMTYTEVFRSETEWDFKDRERRFLTFMVDCEGDSGKALLLAEIYPDESGQSIARIERFKRVEGKFQSDAVWQVVLEGTDYKKARFDESRCSITCQGDGISILYWVGNMRGSNDTLSDWGYIRQEEDGSYSGSFFDFDPDVSRVPGIDGIWHQDFADGSTVIAVETFHSGVAFFSYDGRANYRGTCYDALNFYVSAYFMESPEVGLVGFAYRGDPMPAVYYTDNGGRDWKKMYVVLDLPGEYSYAEARNIVKDGDVCKMEILVVDNESGERKETCLEMIMK